VRISFIGPIYNFYFLGKNIIYDERENVKACVSQNSKPCVGELEREGKWEGEKCGESLTLRLDVGAKFRCFLCLWRWVKELCG